MTDEELKELEKLADAASPGPWHVDRIGDERWIRIGNNEGTLDIFIDIMHIVGAVSNVKFIVASRSAVPALIAEVRRLRAENEKLKQWAFHPKFKIEIVNGAISVFEIDASGEETP